MSDGEGSLDGEQFSAVVSFAADSPISCRSPQSLSPVSGPTSPILRVISSSPVSSAAGRSPSSIAQSPNSVSAEKSWSRTRKKSVYFRSSPTASLVPARHKEDPSKQAYKEFIKKRRQRQDPHAEAKARIKKQIESVYAQKRLERLQDLSLFVTRAFDLADSTGEVVIGRDRDELADDGMKHVTEHMAESPTITGLHISSHCIGPAGATQLAEALVGHYALVELNLNNNQIGYKGAEVLAKAMKDIPTLRSLDLSENRIGPELPRSLVWCTSLRKLYLHHNQLESIPSTMGMHPNLQLFDVAYNRIRNLNEDQIRQGADAMLRELVDQDMRTCCIRGAHNALMQAQLEEYEEGSSGRIHVFPLYDLELNVIKRWHNDHEWLSELLEVHTSLMCLNGLHEWSIPPLQNTDIWNLSGALVHPLYESVFVRNRLNCSTSITVLDISDNDLRGRAAIALAQAVESSQCLTRIDVSGCLWDQGMKDFAVAVNRCVPLKALNLLVLEDFATGWDLRGCLKSVIDVAFVASRLESQGTRLESLNLLHNTFIPEESKMLANAVMYTPNVTLLNGLSLGVGQTKWDLRRRIVDGRGAEGAKTWGTVPVEIAFICNRLSINMVLNELDLSGNSLRDAGMTHAATILAYVKHLTHLYLNNNEVTRRGAAALTAPLLMLTKLQELRMNENRIETEGAQALVAGLQNHVQMKQLSMDDSEIGPLVPSGIATISSLEVLSLRYNKLRVLATDLCELPRLRALLVDSNPIEIPPTKVVRRGFKAVMQFLLQAHQLEPLRREHLRQIQGMSEGKDGLLGLLDPSTKTNTGDSRMNKMTVTQKLQMVHDEARATLNALQVSPINEQPVKEDTPNKTDLPQCILLSELLRHGRAVCGAAFHDEAAALATCSDDRTIKIWQPTEDNLNIWTNSFTLSEHVDAVFCVSFTPANLPLMLASGSRDGTVRLWVPDAPHQRDRKWRCGQVLGKTLKKSKKKHSQAPVEIPEIRCLAFRVFGETNILAAGSTDDNLRIWGYTTEPDSSSESEEEAVGEETTQGITAVEKAARIAELTRIFDCFCQGENPDLLVQQAKDSKDGSPNRKGSSGGGRANHAAPKRFGAMGERGKTMDLGELMAFYRWSGLDKCVPKSLVTRLFKEVNVRHCDGGNDVHELDWEEFSELLFLISCKTTFDVEGQRKIVGKCQWTEYGLFESICGVPVGWLSTAEAPQEDEQTLGWGCLHTLKGHKGGVSAVAWLPQASDLLASASYDEHVMIWHYTRSRGREQWTNVYRGSANNGILTSLSFGLSMSGFPILASSATDGSVMLWKVTIRQIVRETLDGPVRGHAYLMAKGERLFMPDLAGVKSCAFRADGLVLATASDDCVVRLWIENEGSWQLKESVCRHTMPVRAVAFGGGGKKPCLMVTASDDCSCKIIDTRPLLEFGIPMLPPRPSSKQTSKMLMRTFPDRLESKTFLKKPTTSWKFQINSEVMKSLLDDLSSSKAMSKQIDAQPNHGGHLVLPCQPGLKMHTMKLEFEPRTVWTRTTFCISGVNVERGQVYAFEDAVLVSPIVSVTPVATMFRKPVKVFIPHNCAHTDELALVCYSYDEWHALKDFTITETHVIATLGSFAGPMAVVFTGDKQPYDVVFCLPQTVDGRPLTEVSLTLGEPVQGQIEILPCASVQRSTALNTVFRDLMQKQPVYNLQRGSLLDQLHVQMMGVREAYTVESRLISPTIWDGTYALLAFKLLAVSASKQSGSQPASPKRSPQSSFHMSPPQTFQPARRPATMQSLHRSTPVGGQLPPATAHGRSRNWDSYSGENSLGAFGVVPSANAFTLDQPDEVYLGLGVHVQHEVEAVLLVRPFKALKIWVKIHWDFAGTIKVLATPVEVDRDTTLADLRVLVTSWLKKQGARYNLLLSQLADMEFKATGGIRVIHAEEPLSFAHHMCPQIVLSAPTRSLTRSSTMGSLNVVPSRSQHVSFFAEQLPGRPSTTAALRMMTEKESLLPITSSFADKAASRYPPPSTAPVSGRFSTSRTAFSGLL